MLNYEPPRLSREVIYTTAGSAMGAMIKIYNVRGTVARATPTDLQSYFHTHVWLTAVNGEEVKRIICRFWRSGAIANALEGIRKFGGLH